MLLFPSKALWKYGQKLNERGNEKFTVKGKFIWRKKKGINDTILYYMVTHKTTIKII